MELTKYFLFNYWLKEKNDEMDKMKKSRLGRIFCEDYSILLNEFWLGTNAEIDKF